MARGNLLRSSGGGDRFQIEAQEFSELLADVKKFDPELTKALRKRIRDTAKPAVKDVRETVKRIPASSANDGAQRHDVIRKGVAAGVGLRISARKNRGGVTIIATNRRLPADKGGKPNPMHRLLNREKWRHRVFGKDVWVEQQGRPYFDDTLIKYRREFRDAVESALNDAAEALGRKR